MRFLIYCFLFLLSGPLHSQSGGGESSMEDKVLSEAEIKKIKLVERLQDGLAKLRSGEREDNTETRLEACLEIAKLFEDEQYHEKAITYLEQGVALANELGLHQQRMEIQSRLTQSFFKNGQLEEAYNTASELLEQDQMLGNYEAAVRDMEIQAESSIKLGNYVKAREIYVQIMELANLTGDVNSEVTAMNNMGFSASVLGNTKEALHYFEQSEEIAQRNKESIPSHVFTNLGIAWQNLADPTRSITNLHLAEEKENARKSYIEHLISSIYLTNEDIYNALAYNELAIKNAKKTKKMDVMADAYGTASEIYQQLYEYDKALVFYKKHLALKDSLERIEIREQQERENIHAYLAETETSFRQNLIETELKQANAEQMELRNKALEFQLKSEKQALDKERQQQQIAMLEKEKTTKEATFRAAQLEAEKARQALQLATQQNLALKRQQEIEALSQQRQLDSLEAVRKEAEQEQELAIMASQQEIALKEQEQSEFRKRMIWLSILGGLTLLIVTGGLLYSRKLNRKLATQNHHIEQQNEEIESERNRAEGLLLNILPATVASELKQKGRATPKHYEAVTVLFTDFVGFTKIASTLPPAKVVSELNDCFLKFDEIAEKYHLEKIKTMGDAYMCAGGLPVKNNSHPVDAVSAAREIQAFIDQRNNQLRQKGKPVWPIRIGIHTGELVAGVVGSKKFAYDIWGDTVNVASRMESNSEPGQINISEATYQLVSKEFPCTFRGNIDVKNKGKMGMYIVDH